MVNSVMSFKGRHKRMRALKWWRGLSDHTQQALADRYHPNDDFLLTHNSSWRIERIWEKENEG